MAAARTTLPAFVVIDLTQSDDEDIPTAHNRIPGVDPLHAPATRPSLVIPAANYGLTLRESNNIGIGQESREDNGFNISSRSETEAGVKFFGSSGPKVVRIPPTSHRGFRQLQNNGNRTHRHQQYFAQAAFNPGYGDVPVANTAKRRKIHGGMTSLSYELNAQMSIDGDVQVSAMKPIPSREVSTSSSSDSVLRDFEVAPTQVTQNKSRAISELLRAHRDPRISQLPDVITRESEERVIKALEMHVLKHVKTALLEYRKKLSRMERMQIAAKVTHKLIDRPGFLDDLEAHNWVLPGRYSTNVSADAKYFVRILAENLLKKSGAPLNFGSSFSNPFGLPYSGSRSQSPKAADLTIDQDLDSSSTSTFHDEQVFKEHSKSVSYNPELITTGDDCSSPATSFGNEPLGGQSPADPESFAPEPLTIEKQQGPGRPRRSSRLLRRSKLSESALGDAVHNRTTSDSKTVIRPFNYQPSTESIRKAQTLRLSGLERVARPYIRSADLSDIRRGCEIMQGQAGKYMSQAERKLLETSILHVDFCIEEVELLCWLITKSNPPIASDVAAHFISIMANEEQNVETICKIVERKLTIGGRGPGWQLLRSRDITDIRSFLEDAVSGQVTLQSRAVSVDLRSGISPTGSKLSISSLIREREIWGMAPFRVCQGRRAFNVEIASHIEDSFTRRSEWTDCCGDISTLSWTGDNTFICGATAHSDYHNMQYNKPGNLLVGSTSLDTLRAVDGHRIMRPVVKKADNAENSLESMRQTQDPWLYTSVVSTSYSGVSDYTFTASFDETVKVWKVAEDGSSMNLHGTWKHDGKVNFVVTSENHELVATASDVSSNAIRVYRFDVHDIPGTPYDTYSGDKAQEQAAELEREDMWAYFPATIQWGRAPSVANFLLVGYSPRSNTGHEVDIPDEKKNSGELCIWNVQNGQRVQISSARTQNVFEVIWHPTLPIFLAATSPCGVFEPEVKTQIRVFALNNCGTFLHIKTLDCPALDINELTIQPSSLVECYVSASCTDGKTYVWDTSQGDSAIHILGHGASLDNPLHDLPLEIADSGVKFASWGASTGRFYTGSSDGKVKAWDVRAPRGEAFIRTVLSVSGGISAGAFSKNYSKLLIGDATGKVHLIDVDSDNSDDDDMLVSERASTATTIDQRANQSKDGSQPSLKMPRVIMPHPEPLLPGGLQDIDTQGETAHSIAHAYIESGQLILHPDRGIGVIQGPNYADSLLYRSEAHEGGDGTKPLRPEWGARQQFHLHSQVSTLRVPRLLDVKGSDPVIHNINKSLDLDISLSSPVKEAFARDGIDLNFEESHKFDLEPVPRYEIFRTKH